MSEETKDQAPTTSNINVSADVFKAGADAALKAEKIDAAQHGLLWWFFCHAKAQGYGYGNEEAGNAIGYDSTTIYRLFHWSYAGSLENICTAIGRYKRIAEERAGRVELAFVETSISRNIFRVCDAALITQTIAFVYGDSQIGKTTALEEFQRRNNHGATIYLRMPASSGVQLFAREFAKASMVSPHSSFENLRERILARIDDKTLVIIDEVHQVFLSYQKGSQMKVLEFIREIYDRSHCGLVLCGTNVFKSEVQTGKLSLMLEQLRRRGTIKLQLPKAPPKADLDRIAKRFGLEPAEGLAAEVIKDMIHSSGLGMYVKFLQNAAMMASKQKQKLSWEHFVQAHDIIQKLSAA